MENTPSCTVISLRVLRLNIKLKNYLSAEILHVASFFAALLEKAGFIRRVAKNPEERGSFEDDTAEYNVFYTILKDLYEKRN